MASIGGFVNRLRGLKIRNVGRSLLFLAGGAIVGMLMATDAVTLPVLGSVPGLALGVVALAVFYPAYQRLGGCGCSGESGCTDDCGCSGDCW